MQTISTHFHYALLEAWAERRTSIIRLLQFIGITFILGFAFNSAFQTPDFDKVEIGYVSADLGPGGQEYLDELTGTDGFDELATFTEVDNFEDGRKLVQSGEIGALIHLGDDFTETLEDTDATTDVSVYSMEYSGFNYIVVQAIVDGFNNGANATWAIQSIGEHLPADSTALTDSAIDETSVSDIREMTGMTYYAVGMLLFLVLFGAEFGSFGISKEFLGTMHSRTYLAPQRTWHLVVGKLSAYSLVVMLQAIIFMIVTGIVLQVDWFVNLPLILLTVYVFGALSIALGMAVMMITRDMKKTTTIIQALVIGFTFLGGGFIATDFYGSEMISPNYYAREALFGALFDDAVSLSYNYVGILVGITMLLIIVSAIASRRRVA